jgi:hypothetical protein
LSKPKQSVSERAEQAGAFKAWREGALASDPGILGVRWTGREVDASGLADAELAALPEPDLSDPDVRAVVRMSTEAVANDAYRVQLIDLAALHGELFLEAVKAPDQ